MSGIADPFNGHINAFRIFQVQRSDGRIATIWNYMSDPGAFAASGAEEQEGGEPPLLAGMPEPLTCRTEEICHGRLVCIMPPDHPLATHAEITAADVAAHPWISYVEGQTLLPIIDGAFAASGLAVNPSIRVLSISTVCSLVECGAGIGLVDEFSAKSAARRFEYRVFSPLTHIGVDVLHPGEEEPPLVLEFIEHLRRELGTEDRDSCWSRSCAGDD